MTDRTITIDEQVAVLRQAKRIAGNFAEFASMSGFVEGMAEAAWCEGRLRNLIELVEATRL